MHEIFFYKMNLLDQYNVPVSELDEKEISFKFKVSDNFFSVYENSEIKGGNIDVVLKICKINEILNLNFKVKGSVKIICDRCLEEFDQKISFSDSIFVESGDETNFDSEGENVILSREANEINVSQFIYEFAHFALPFTRFHPVDKSGISGCNPEMLEILNKHKVQKKEDIADPRWEKLAEIKKSNVK